MRQSVLIVDDMTDMLKYLSRLIGKTMEVDLHTAPDAETALDILAREEIPVVLTDVRMPKMDGLQFLKKVKELNDRIVVIMVTAFGSIENAVESLKFGAYDYVTKPFDEEMLMQLIRRALELDNLTRKNPAIEKRFLGKEEKEAFVGRSHPIRTLVETLEQAAETEATVLIRGETGTGKDLAAKIIHASSSRAAQPFVAVNCPAISGNILESDPFGRNKGAFSGAARDKEEIFETADGGTIFLDEIGDISPTLQARLLRVLREKEFKPLGDNRARLVNARIIASTNRNIEEKITRGEFRNDLYYLLNVVSIRTPSLREIPEDIPLITNHFLSLYCAELGVPAKKLSAEAYKMLVSKRWSGNVRELQNELKRAVIFTIGDAIAPADLEARNRGPSGLEERASTSLDVQEYREARKKLLDRFDVRYITHALEETGGNVSEAARKAGLERQSLQYLMKKHGIAGSQFRSGAI